MTLDLVARKDGEVVEGAEVSGMSYQVGKGGMLDGLDEALTGMSAGETTTFSAPLAGGEHEGEQADITVTATTRTTTRRTSKPSAPTAMPWRTLASGTRTGAVGPRGQLPVRELRRPA